MWFLFYIYTFTCIQMKVHTHSHSVHYTKVAINNEHVYKLQLIKSGGEIWFFTSQFSYISRVYIRTICCAGGCFVQHQNSSYTTTHQPYPLLYTKRYELCLRAYSNSYAYCICKYKLNSQSTWKNMFLCRQAYIHIVLNAHLFIIKSGAIIWIEWTKINNEKIAFMYPSL